MVRIIGTLLLLAGSSGMAYSYCHEQNERLKILKNMREIFIRIKNEIEYLKASIPEICFSLGEKNISFNKVFTAIYEELELNNGCSFNEIWQRHFTASLKNMPLKETEKEMIKSFPDSLVYRESKGQADGMEKYINEVSKYVGEIETVIKNKNKVMMCVGVMAGMITTVILL
ncbi:MAG: stage III sporulation protein AB [Lachnospiraceae bacterium]|nr:stage III sporulation protein AB [Lachnospiraceae bacterium]